MQFSEVSRKGAWDPYFTLIFFFLAGIRSDDQGVRAIVALEMEMHGQDGGSNEQNELECLTILELSTNYGLLTLNSIYI